MTLANPTLRKWRDAASLAFAGYSPRSRVVIPEVPDHRYQMTLSRYLFACRFAKGHSVLDFGSGSGFGANPIRKAGAVRYVGLEEYVRPVRNATRKYGSPQTQFRHSPLGAPSSGFGEHGLVLAFDLLSRYEQAESVLARIAAHVEPEGTLVAGVPLVSTKEDIDRTLAAGAKTVLYPWFWKAIFEEHFGRVRSFRHCGPNAILDWEEPSPSEFSATDFRFEEEEHIASMVERQGLSALFVCSDRR